ncbi:MAG: tRNA pseudouridine(38-40) synthase TruA [Anaerolineae bacterium]|nr:tRNA pseudouridine(38-40) synthase TruA [Anaerolineae bacterium]
MKYRAILAYDGTAYQGFQRQAEGIPTIQAAVEQAIKTVTQQVVTVNGAGRTDAGVHAAGQVITFAVDWRHHHQVLLQALNARLPDDIVLQMLVEELNDKFHPRFSAQSRSYNYNVLQTVHRQPLLRNRAWYVRSKLDADVMQAAAKLLVGEHDFATFGQPPQGENTVRLVFRSDWQIQPEMLIYHIEATAFLQHMVRRMVGMLVDVGRGWLTLKQFEDRFRRADLSLAKTIAPPQGLTLEAVRYPPD